MLRVLLIAISALLFSQVAHAADQVQFFPPSGPCTADNPILAWNGSGSTYCTRFPTAALPDCKDGQFLTKKNGVLVCSDLSGQNVTAPTTTTPTTTTTTPTTTPTTSTTTPTTPYTSSSTPTGIPQRVAATQGGSTTIPNPVVRTGSNVCPNITIPPACGSDYVLVDYGLDSMGCQTSPVCRYVGRGNAASYYATYTGYVPPNAYVDTYYTDTYVDTYAPAYVETPYVEPYVESAPSYDEPYYAGDGGADY